jgi:ribosome biogenesis GTPase A
MGRTVWYPGHMAKGKRQLEALAKNIDLIIEVRDARIPNLSTSPMINMFAPKIRIAVVLSKADLAEARITKLWVDYLRSKSFHVWALNLRQSGVTPIKKSLASMRPEYRDLRIAVVGIPNVGKSMLINQLAGRRAAAVGGVPGVTRGVSWFKGDGFLLVDSPGILDPHGDARAQRMISWIGSSRGDVIGSWEEHAKECIAFLIRRGLWNGAEKAWNVNGEGEPSEILEKIGHRLGKLMPGGLIDLEASGRAFLDAFSSGRLGKMSLEKPGDPPIWESL